MTKSNLSSDGHAGSGHTTDVFGAMEGANIVPTHDANGEPRDGFTRRVYATACGVPWYQQQKNHLAGGARGTPDNPIEDFLPNTEYS